MANIDVIKKRYSLEGDTYASADADRAIADLFAVSRKLALQNKELEAQKAAMDAEIAGLKEERDKLAEFKAGEADAVKSVQQEFDKLEDEKSMLMGRIDTLAAAIDSLEKDKLALSDRNAEMATLNNVLTADKNRLTLELSSLRAKISFLEEENGRLAAGNAPAPVSATVEEPASEPAQEPVAEPVTETVTEPVAEVAEEPAEEAVPEAEEAPAEESAFETAAVEEPAAPATAQDIPEIIDNSEEEIYRRLAESVSAQSATEPEKTEPAKEEEKSEEQEIDPLEDELRRVLELQNEKESNPYGLEDEESAKPSRSIGDMKSRLASIKNKNK